jgi:PST family polysaccharide transporter
MKQTRSISTKKRLLHNFFSLSVLQIINNIIPLLVFPYLIRVLGIENFGILAFVLAVTAYGMILTDYGFDLSATKLVSIHRENQEKLNEIFSSVITIKIFLGVIYFVTIILLVLFVDKFAQNSLLYFLAFGLVLGEILFPTWFFQGMEQMRFITIINAIAKITFTLMIFIFVKNPSDLYIVPMLNSMGAVSAAVSALYVTKKYFHISFQPQKYQTLLYYLKDGWYIFTSRIAVELYITSNVIILGLLASNTVVGYYSVVEKTINAIGRLLDPITRTVYPYLAKLYQDSVVLFYKRNTQLSFLIFILMLPMAIILYIYAEEILHLVAGDRVTDEMIHLLRILSCILPFYLYGSQYTNMLVTLNETKLLNKIVTIAGISNIIIAPIAISLYGAVGLAWTNVLIMYGIYTSKGYFTLYKFKKRDMQHLQV